jgi:hypothetical protein
VKLTKRCLYCRSKYTPNPRTNGFQRACPKPTCQRKRKLDAFRLWCDRNPSYYACRKNKIRDWAKSRSYWKHYRQKNPSYTELNRSRSKLRFREKMEIFAKQSAIGADPMRFLDAIRCQIARPKIFAKQSAITALLDEILAYLSYKESLQNQSLSTQNTPPRYDGDPVVLSELGRQKKAVTDH